MIPEIYHPEAASFGSSSSYEKSFGYTYKEAEMSLLN